MKKLVIATVLTSSFTLGLGGQADAASQSNNVQTQVHTVNIQELDQEKVKKWLNEVYQSYQFRQDTNQKVVSEEKAVPTERENRSTQQKPATQESQNVEGVTQEEQQMIDLVNQERAERGLSPLTINMELTEVARVKAQDMIDNNYFAHQSPTYGSPFDMLSQFGVEYQTAGENLAGNQTVEAAHQALMNSDGHRANILNANYQEVGIGIIEGGPYGKMFVQLFKG
ncbi:CAP domain-containing protein [Halalkalibacter kiskunsagensis]|uniref:CAP domain-containing protein n=1 Tax=Halalkalibacter kiskunsagensis TaxID=1548599 RepID=A0ABV6K7M5_9BACI